MHTTVDYIKERICNFVPEVGVILGSGLGEFADKLDATRISYNDIPKFHVSEVEGHKGQLVFAEIEGKKAVIMQGRYHFYEGYPLSAVVYPVQVMKLLGVKKLIITNAAGATHKGFLPGDLMLIKDHINFMGTNPLIGKNNDELGVRFPDMSDVYKKDARLIIHEIARNLRIDLKEGVYLALSGPSYETPAEIKMFRTMGADAVGMSTVPEAIVANHCSMDVIGISCITNYAAGVNDVPLSHSEVIETADRVKENFERLLSAVIRLI